MSRARREEWVVSCMARWGVSRLVAETAERRMYEAVRPRDKSGKRRSDCVRTREFCSVVEWLDNQRDLAAERLEAVS